MGFLFIVGAGILWWAGQPHSAAALYTKRCAACHDLPEMCRFPPEQRVDIVRIMRQAQGASSVISEREAELITAYLSEELPCQ